jgi:predicted MFS family arabinose efflux permease
MRRESHSRGGRATDRRKTQPMDAHWIATAFGAVNSIRVLFYLPQIMAVARSTDGARDIALSTWALWALTNALGAAYGAVVARDALLATSFALSMVACVVTLALTAIQRLRWARRIAMSNHRCVGASQAGCR